jgi:hypothetical protein
MKAASCRTLALAAISLAINSAEAENSVVDWVATVPSFRLVPLPPGLKAVLVPTPAQIKYQGAMSALIHFGQSMQS